MYIQLLLGSFPLKPRIMLFLLFPSLKWFFQTLCFLFKLQTLAFISVGNFNSFFFEYRNNEEKTFLLLYHQTWWTLVLVHTLVSVDLSCSYLRSVPPRDPDSTPLLCRDFDLNHHLPFLNMFFSVCYNHFKNCMHFTCI